MRSTGNRLVDKRLTIKHGYPTCMQGYDDLAYRTKELLTIEGHTYLYRTETGNNLVVFGVGRLVVRPRSVLLHVLVKFQN